MCYYRNTSRHPGVPEGSRSVSACRPRGLTPAQRLGATDAVRGAGFAPHDGRLPARRLATLDESAQRDRVLRFGC